jgi:hypothetical protein
VPDSAERLVELRRMYEPYVYSLSLRQRLPLPPWIPKMSRVDNWQISAWGRSKGFRQTAKSGRHEERHFS